MAAATSSHGYSCPSQPVTGKDVLNKIFFMSDEKWETARTSKSFDYVIIGSSFCALAFVDRVLQNNPNANIIILERGDYFHPDHFENLPSTYVRTLGGIAETFPWSITEKTHNGDHLQWVHGMYNYFGGRSSFWGGWCPEPTDEEMEDWPSEVINTVHKYFPAAAELLNVTPANKIFDREVYHKPIFGLLQDTMDEILTGAHKNIKTVTRVYPAPLAVVAAKQCEGYRKFSVQEKLLHLAISTSLRLKIDCLVTRINHDGLTATSLETNRGTFTLGRAKLILAMGSLPPTTLVLNSFPVSKFPLLKNVGERFTGHFISSIVARFPINHLPNNGQVGDHEMAGNHIAGIDKQSHHHFHIQLSSVLGGKKSLSNVMDTTRKIKGRIIASPSVEQLSTSEGFIVLLCSCLGQLDHNNSENWFRKNDGKDLTTNVDLQVVTNDTDNALWDTMDSSTFEVLEKIIDSNSIEYWHSASEETPACHEWKRSRPSKAQIHCPAVVHEGSTMWIGNDREAPVGLDYRLKGVENVFVTGNSLWPTGASWNPTGVMTALAIHLADKLSASSSAPTACNISFHNIYSRL